MKQRIMKVYNIKQLILMEQMLIYEIQSSNNQISQLNENYDFDPSKISSKETQIQQGLVMKTIKVRSNSSQSPPQKTQFSEQILKDIEKRQENIIFYEQDLSKTHSSLDVDQTNRGFLKRKVQSGSDDSDEYQDEVQQLQKLNQIYEQQQTPQKHKKILPQQTTLENKTVLVTANVALLIKQLVPKGYKLTCYLQISKGFLGLGGVYRLFLGQQRQFLMSAKKQVLKYYSNFLISRHHRQIHKRSQIYLGRLESNFIGTQFKLFSVKDEFENMKMFINYKKNIVGLNGLRNLKAYKINPEIRNQQFFSTLTNVLERNQRSKLLQLSTAEPILKKGKYRLDFKGKVRIPSAKNFILLNNEGQQSLLFGKVSEDEYIVQVNYPLTIFEAFGICLSSLDSKLMVN